MTFDDLGLSRPVLQALKLKGYETPSPIQSQAIPHVLAGKDILGIAQTGTGKTAAFMLPSIDRLNASDKHAPRRSARMLVLAPTRELAGQIATSARDYSALAAMKVTSVVGGTSVSKDRQKLARGSDILVATPGRLLDMIDQNALTLDGVEILVLDEADQMLDLGFIHALRRIVGLLPKERQTLFFSATMPRQIKELASRYLNRPEQVAVAPQATTAERVAQHAILVQQNEKQAMLNLMLSGRYAIPGAIDRVLIFTRTKHGADRVVKKLAQSGIEANAIHGNKSQPQRQRALGEFRKGQVPILVATDVAARGIDIPGVSHVINFELPNVAEQYVHRIGRTARAGADGVAISFCAEDERAYLRDIQRLTGVTLERLPLPENFRAVVEGVGPERRAQKSGVGKARVTPRGASAKRGPAEDNRDQARRKGPKRKHSARAGRPRREEGQNAGGAGYERREGRAAEGRRDRPHGERTYGERPQSERREGGRSERARNDGSRPQRSERTGEARRANSDGGARRERHNAGEARGAKEHNARRGQSHNHRHDDAQDKPRDHRRGPKPAGRGAGERSGARPGGKPGSRHGGRPDQRSGPKSDRRPAGKRGAAGGGAGKPNRRAPQRAR